MAPSNALLGLVRQIAPPGTDFHPVSESPGALPVPDGAEQRLMRVELATALDRNIAYLDPEDPRYRIWQPMLETLKESATPAFFRVADNGLVTDTRMPVVGRVLDVKPAKKKGDFEVRLDMSATRDVVSADTDEGREMLDLLQAFKEKTEDLVVTADRDTRRIINVSRVTPGVSAQRGESVTFTDTSQPPADTDSIKKTDLSQFYADLSGNQCTLPAVAGGCLPLQWADDLCYVMADHMCELLHQKKSLTAAKVWLHGSLRLRTRNHPACAYTWGYHVGAVLKEKNTGKVLVIDPVVSIDGPLTLAQWRKHINGTEETPLFTPKSVFNCGGPGSFMKKITPNSTINGLKAMRDHLRQRANNRPSPPPFANCHI